MKTIIIIDEDLLAIKLLKKFIAEREDIICVNSFINPQEAVTYLQNNPIDIVLVCVDMSVSGFKFKKSIPETCAIIFTSTSPVHALEAFNQNAVDYFLKPIVQDRLNQAINKAMRFINNKNIPSDELPHQVVLNLKVNKSIHKVIADDLIYIESLREYICYFTQTEKIIAFGALKDVYKLLPQDSFIRIHKSHIINKKHITSYNATSVTLSNGKVFAIGRVYKQDFINAVKEAGI